MRPNESLNSYLVRLAKLNGYTPPGILSELVVGASHEPSRTRDRIGLPSLVMTYERLAMLTRTEASILYTSTPHRFASVLIPPDITIQFKNISGESVPLLPSGIASKQLRPSRAAQFCPVCLKTSPYHRLIWAPIAVSACLEHKCLLLTSCHFCDKKISVHDLITAQCSMCESSLFEAEAQPLDGDEFGLFSQRFIQSWLRNNLTPQDIAVLLPEQSPRVLYRIIDGLRQAIIALGDPMWPYLHKVDAMPLKLTFGQEKQTLTPYESYCLYATACKGLVDWPQGFYEFLRAYKTQRKGDQPIHSGPKIDLGNIYTQWLQDYWQHPAFAFVHEAFERYFSTNYWLSSPVARSALCRNDPDTARAFVTISIAEAARIMSATPRWIELLINTGRLASYAAADCSRIKFVSKTEVLELQHQWNESITRLEAASWLGVTEKMITNMVKVGFLQAEFCPSDGFPRWLFSKSVVVKLLEKLTKHILCLTAQEQAERALISLTAASQLVFVVGLDAVSILQEVAEGKLFAYKAHDGKLLLGSLFFARHELVQYTEDVRAGNSWISREEARRLLGVKDGTLARWVKAGLLPPCATYGHVQYFSTSTLRQFTSDYITCDEAAQILGIGKLAVQKWVRTGRLITCCACGPDIDGSHAYRFNKERLLHWRSERLTFGEAAQLLKISGATLHRWASEGDIEALEDMGGKQRWFSRKAILELREKKISANEVKLSFP